MATPFSNPKGYPDHDWTTKRPAPVTPPDPFALLRPFLQSWTVGFDHQFELLEDLRKNAKTTTYPPYNIKEIEEGSCYEIEMAVAGFAKEDVTISVQDSTLTVSGGSKESKADTYVHKGIAARTFEQKFGLAEYVEVSNATLENGILTITLKRELPEEKKPKVIEIK
jgi:molecular chaperone IbpA